MIAPQRPLSRLLVAHAPAARRAGDRLVWAFDERLADLARTTREPMIGQMRLAWWEEALGDESGVKGRGDPLLDAMRAAGLVRLRGLGRMLDGWEALLGGDLDDDALADFAAGRGEGLFMALAREDAPPDGLRAAGRLWALWDMSGHVGDDRVRARAVALARADLAAVAGAEWPRGWRAARLAAGLAARDIGRGRAADPRFSVRLYGRLMRIALVGR